MPIVVRDVLIAETVLEDFVDSGGVLPPLSIQNFLSASLRPSSLSAFLRTSCKLTFVVFRTSSSVSLCVTATLDELSLLCDGRERWNYAIEKALRALSPL